MRSVIRRLSVTIRVDVTHASREFDCKRRRRRRRRINRNGPSRRRITFDRLSKMSSGAVRT